MSISSTGVVLTPSSTAIAEAQQILINTYGSSVNLSQQSPNGLLVQNQALAITQRENDQADVVNSINPLIATGQQLDALCSNMGIQREPATKSTATCIFTGLTGVSITEGSQVSNENGDIFIVDATYVIGGDGTATGTVTAQNSGTILVPTNSIDKIVTGIPGWSTVNNSTAGNVGTVEESDYDLLLRFFDTTAFNSAGSYQSILAGASQLSPKPTSVYVLPNNTKDSYVKDGITIESNSILLSIDGGGSDTLIAEMFLKRVSCTLSGSYSFTIPIPNTSETFTAKWQKATQLALSLNLQLKVGYVYPPNVKQFIADAITQKFNWNVIGRYIDATQFIYLLIQAGVTPILSLTFNVGTTTNLIQYTMPISSSLGNTLLSTNVNLTYV